MCRYHYQFAIKFCVSRTCSMDNSVLVEHFGSFSSFIQPLHVFFLLSSFSWRKRALTAASRSRSNLLSYSLLLASLRLSSQISASFRFSTFSFSRFCCLINFNSAFSEMRPLHLLSPVDTRFLSAMYRCVCL